MGKFAPSPDAYEEELRHDPLRKKLLSQEIPLSEYLVETFQTHPDALLEVSVRVAAKSQPEAVSYH